MMFLFKLSLQQVSNVKVFASFQLSHTSMMGNN